MDKIYIEGIEVDSSDIFSTTVSYLIDDIKDFGARNCSVSKTIILPGTKHNNKVFGGIFNIASYNNYDSTKPNVNLNFNASVKAQCHVFRDNLQSVKGVAQLLGINIVDGIVEYELGITGELGGFVSALGSSKLEDLDFSSYDQLYTIANIIASKSNVGSGSGVVYPLIDYGTYSTLKHDWQYKTFRPSLFVKEYIDKIFAASGYTYDCNLFNSSRFKGLIIPHNQKLLTRKSYTILRMDANFQQYNNSNPGSGQVVFSNTITLVDFTTSDYETFTYSGTGFSGRISLELSFTYSGGSGNLYIKIYKNATLLSTNTYVNGTFLETIDNPISLSSGDAIYVEYDLIPNRTLTINDGKLNAISDILKRVPLSLGKEIVINDTLPQNILQKDFISSICKLFNLLVYEDTLKDKHLKIAPFSSDGVTDGFYSLGAVDDWTNYLDLSQAIKIKPMAELNARYYEFNYKDDSDFHNDAYKKRYNKTYGSFKYDSNYQFSKDSHKVEVIFSGTPIVGYQGEDKVYSTILKSSNGNEETIDSNIRILQTKVVTGVTSWNILAADNTTVLGTYTDYLYAGHFDDPDAPSNDINFGVPDELFFKVLTGTINVNQFNVYWSAYLAELTDKDARLVTATFKLPLKEIANLDFGKYKYIAGVLYRLNKIIDYNTSREDTCSVEVIKVINKIY